MTRLHSDIQKIMSGGRVTIPEKVRKELDLKEGDYIMGKVQGNTFVVTPVQFEPRK